MAAPTLLGSLERAVNHWTSGLSKGPNRVGAAIILPEDGNRSSSQNIVYLETLDYGRSPKS
jgi:hypothetical protein